MVKHGTNRLVIIGKDFVYKIPFRIRGIRANRIEYINSLKRAGYVALTEKHWWGLKQERLFNTVCYKQGTTRKELAEEHKHLYKLKLTNRIQIGQDKHGVWKFYDYEDVKFSQNLS